MSLIGVVLAGGRSARMGRDKALLDWQGRTWLDHAICQLKTIGANRIYISGSYDGYACIPDCVGLQGPMGGILSCLSYILPKTINDTRSDYHQSQSILFLPVDMPTLSHRDLQTLISGHHNCDGVCFNQGPLPVCLFVTHNLIDTVHNYLTQPESQEGISVRQFLSSLKIKHHECLANYDNFNYPSEIPIIRIDQ
jgi:molybdopterin-guanine dinucleotide biosynthesis protein A